jgi:hypothetical protein
MGPWEGAWDLYIGRHKQLQYHSKFTTWSGAWSGGVIFWARGRHSGEMLNTPSGLVNEVVYDSDTVSKIQL